MKSIRKRQNQVLQVKKINCTERKEKNRKNKANKECEKKNSKKRTKNKKRPLMNNQTHRLQYCRYSPPHFAGLWRGSGGTCRHATLL
ncbi:hypothetical protein QL285_031215 [Trifolium repens]|nr:hypothetical protein QL285_031215 [Trifolium repens]